MAKKTITGSAADSSKKAAALPEDSNPAVINHYKNERAKLIAKKNASLQAISGARERLEFTQSNIVHLHKTLKHPEKSIKIARLADEARATTRKLINMGEKLAETEKQIKEINKLIKARKNVPKIRKANSKQEEKITAAAEKEQAPTRKEMKEQLRAMKEKHRHEIEVLNHNKDELNSKIATAQEKVGGLESQLDSLVKEKNSLNAKKAVLLHTIESLQGILPRGRPKKQEARHGKDSLIDRKQLRERVEEIRGRARAEMAQTRKEVRKLNAQLEANAKQISSMKRKITNGKKPLVALNEEVSKVTGQITEQQSKLDAIVSSEKEKRKSRWVKFVLGVVILAMGIFSLFRAPGCNKIAEDALNAKAPIVQPAPAPKPVEVKDHFVVPDKGGYWHIAENILSERVVDFQSMPTIEKNRLAAKLTDYLIANKTRLGITMAEQNSSGPNWLNKGADMKFTQADWKAFSKGMETKAISGPISNANSGVKGMKPPMQLNL